MNQPIITCIQTAWWRDIFYFIRRHNTTQYCCIDLVCFFFSFFLKICNVHRRFIYAIVCLAKCTLNTTVCSNNFYTVKKKEENSLEYTDWLWSVCGNETRIIQSAVYMKRNIPFIEIKAMCIWRVIPSPRTSPHKMNPTTVHHFCWCARVLMNAQIIHTVTARLRLRQREKMRRMNNDYSIARNIIPTIINNPFFVDEIVHNVRAYFARI